MAYIHRLIALALLLLCTSSFAAFPPAPQWRGQTYGALYTQYAPSKEQAIKASCSLWAAEHGGLAEVQYIRSDMTLCKGGDGVGETFNGVPAGSGVVCPSNSMGDTNCTCNAGFAQSEGMCIATGGVTNARDFCDGMGQVKAPWKLVGRTSGSTPETSCYMPDPPFEGADASKGCVAKLGDSVAVPNGDGTRSWSATGVATGGVCSDAPAVGDGSSTQNPPPRAAENPCPSGFPGSVNGASVCVPTVPDSGVGGVTKKETVKADGSKEITDEVTECNAGQCTTTTTKKTTDANGNQTSSSTTTTKEAIGTKCAADAGNKVCSEVGLGRAGGSGTGNAGGGGGKGDGSGDSSFGGDCAAGFKAVSDDAVINAMAEETFRQNCKVNPDVLSQAVGKAANEAPADAISKDNAAFESKELKDAISQEDIVGGSQCISDKSITVAGKQFLIPLSNVCDPFRYIGYIAVAASMLLAFRIVGSNK